VEHVQLKISSFLLFLGADYLSVKYIFPKALALGNFFACKIIC